MHFDVRLEGPADVCGKDCRTWVSAIGAITADSPREFDLFVQKNDIRGATLVLDSDGGSVLGALSLGRAVRALNMKTTVGKTVDLAAGQNGEKRARLMPRAYCESMCAFVLLAGVERHVPAEARVLVHQIWLGDRRDDPTSANYSAEDLVLVQRDIGRLAQYTIEMGGTIDLLEIALKIPPWEPMRLLSRDELRAMKMVTADDGQEVNSGTATPQPAAASGTRVQINSDRSWAVVEAAGLQTLSRRHPLTVEGDEIGNFEVSFACGEAGKDYRVTYTERRRIPDGGRAPEAVTDVELMVGGRSVPLTVKSSQPSARPNEFETVATGLVPTDLMKAFADPRSRSLTVETNSEEMTTAIRLGNAGVARSFVHLAASCGSPAATRSAARQELRREAEVQPR
jgi:hypothetical protein